MSCYYSIWRLANTCYNRIGRLANTEATIEDFLLQHRDSIETLANTCYHNIGRLANVGYYRIGRPSEVLLL